MMMYELDIPAHGHALLDEEWNELKAKYPKALLLAPVA